MRARGSFAVDPSARKSQIPRRQVVPQPPENPEDELRPYHEVSDLRMLLAKPLTAAAVLCAGSAAFAWVEWGHWLGAFAGLTSLASACVFWGVWNAEEWARWTLGSLSLLGAFVIHVPYVIGAMPFETGYLKISIALVVGAVLALNPSMKRHFATVRDVLAGREVRGRRAPRRIEKPATMSRTPRPRAARDEDAPPDAGAQ